MLFIDSFCICGYAKVLCHHPYVVLSSVIIVVGICLALSLTAKPLPSFTDPALVFLASSKFNFTINLIVVVVGFESRGTIISERATAWKNLLDSTNARGPLIVNPLGNPEFKHTKQNVLPNGEVPVHKHKVCIEMTVDGPVEVADNCTEIDNKTRIATPTDETSFDMLRQMGRYSDSKDTSSANGASSSSSLDYKWQESDFHPDEGEGGSEDDHANHVHLSPDGFFCNELVTSQQVPEYGHVVIKNKDPMQNLFSLHNLKAVCELDSILRSPLEINSICERSSGTRCCPSWSLPNYVALLSNKTSCMDLTLCTANGSVELYLLDAIEKQLKL
ncbi:Protein dispatched-like protein 2 [Armadillidium nasatum]|uniref:Protein dispatched-like protein 2 n=1 Tax=Armadillidium nasatum TaxID=96803 RepID=A0A5N5SUI6_9CRUS|nr:Protein dispatched-like protein 2 [Armadillidium nasatum]